VVGVYRRIPVISEFLISNHIQKFKFKEITTMTKLTLTEQEELFAKDCKLINLRYEYTNYTGKEKWAVVTELTEKELRKKYPDIHAFCFAFYGSRGSD
jgi:hypothetical protein